jgi:multidrug efflux pump subunit AcrB
VVVTLALTLFASWAYGFTLNRVSLFALIFSIGILVDDAIVVVENIHRHMALWPRKRLLQLMPGAVDEVGSPTILATFTVIAALLPMAFVTGLMGPYMSPIPINASMGMLISLVVAFVFTPWMSNFMLGKRHDAAPRPGPCARARRPRRRQPGAAGLLQSRHRSVPGRRQGHPQPLAAAGGILMLIAGSMLLAVNKVVILKMLPFDNKSEFQVVLDMPEGTSLEQTARVLARWATTCPDVPEVTDYQVYAGTAAPINFNGLVRQYYLREGAHLGDIQVNLVDKHHRDEQSHTHRRCACASRCRPSPSAYDGNAKIVEIPPGPPVLSPLVAEVYGIDYDGQIAIAKQVREAFGDTADIVDIDDSVEYPSDKVLVVVDRAKAARLGVEQASVAQALATVLDGEDMSFLHGANVKYAVPIRVEYEEADKADLEQVLACACAPWAGNGAAVGDRLRSSRPAAPTASTTRTCCRWSTSPATWPAKTDSPLYGLFEIAGQLTDDLGLTQWYMQPAGEPLRVQRQMGRRVAGHLRDLPRHGHRLRRRPAPDLPAGGRAVPQLPGAAGDHGADPADHHRHHARPCPARRASSPPPAMIGMIALAGIIVRNSILLVDFIIFGLAISTVMTVLLIPLLYYVFIGEYEVEQNQGSR